MSHFLGGGGRHNYKQPMKSGTSGTGASTIKHKGTPKSGNRCLHDGMAKVSRWAGDQDR